MANKKQTRILVADREPEWSAFVAETLRSAGYEVQLEDNVNRVLRTLAEIGSDLVLADASLEELVDALAKKHHDAPFVVFTTSPSVPQAIQAYRHGALDYANKAFDPKTLLAVIHKALKKRPVPSELVFC